MLLCTQNGLSFLLNLSQKNVTFNTYSYPGLLTLDFIAQFTYNYVTLQQKTIISLNIVTLPP